MSSFLRTQKVRSYTKQTKARGTTFSRIHTISIILGLCVKVLLPIKMKYICFIVTLRIFNAHHAKAMSVVPETKLSHCTSITCGECGQFDKSSNWRWKQDLLCIKTKYFALLNVRWDLGPRWRLLHGRTANSWAPQYWSWAIWLLWALGMVLIEVVAKGLYQPQENWSQFCFWTILGQIERKSKHIFCGV